MITEKKSVVTKGADKDDEDVSRPQIIDSEFFVEGVNQNSFYTKMILFSLLVWSFLTRNKNLDFIWSYLSAMQIITHMSLLKN